MYVDIGVYGVPDADNFETVGILVVLLSSFVFQFN